MSRVYPESFQADYSRLEQTPFTRKRLEKLRCVVVGAGALGNEVARILGLLGAARVHVVDPDIVEATNLPRSVFFCGRSSLGKNKAVALADAASAMFPETIWTATDKEIADVGFGDLVRAALVFSCVDSDLARLEIAYISNKLNIPVVDGGLGRQNYAHGRVTYFPGGPHQACYGCMLSPTRRRELLELWQATVRPCSEASAGEDLVSTPTMAGVTGCIQVELGLRWFFQSDEDVQQSARSVEIQIHPARRMEEFTIPVSADCPFHDFQEWLHPLTRGDCTFGQLLDDSGSDGVILDWPICVDAKCMDCGEQWAPMLRLAALRRRGRCPKCGSSKILELQTIRDIARGSSWISQKPAALQLPANHLYSVRLPASS